MTVRKQIVFLMGRELSLPDTLMVHCFVCRKFILTRQTITKKINGITLTKVIFYFIKNLLNGFSSSKS